MLKRPDPTPHLGDGESRQFDVMYPMLGEKARSELAVQLGAETAECGELVVDDFQCTNVCPGCTRSGTWCAA